MDACVKVLFFRDHAGNFTSPRITHQKGEELEMPSKDSVMILGAGIFGLTGAIELARRGHSVTVMDPGPIPHPKAASNDISKAVRMDYGSDEFYMSLMEEAFWAWDRWNLESEQTLYHQDGF